MRRLTREQQQTKAALEARLTEQEAALQGAISEFNSVMEAQWESVQQAMTAHNQAVQEANTFIQSVHSAQEEYMDGRAETWSETPGGEAYEGWASEWGDVDLDEADFDAPEALEELGLDGAEQFANLTDAPS